MATKYTAIYTESWMSGSHRQTITKMKRIELADGETESQALESHEIADSTVFLFHGWPLMQGEEA